MPLSPKPLTELDALNSCLAAIGQAPVTSFDDDDNLDVENAKRALTDVYAEVLHRGHSWCTEVDVTVQPDVDGFVTITDHLKAEITPMYSTRNLTLRGGRVYNSSDQTFVIGTSVPFDYIVYVLDFDDAPESVKRYVAARASRNLAARDTVNEARMRELYDAEHRAQADMDREELNASSPNLYNSVPALRR